MATCLWAGLVRDKETGTKRAVNFYYSAWATESDAKTGLQQSLPLDEVLEVSNNPYKYKGAEGSDGK